MVEHSGTDHSWYAFEAKPFRALKSLSDLNGTEVYYLEPGLRKSLMAASLLPGREGGLEIGVPRKLFEFRANIIVPQLNSLVYSPASGGRFLVNASADAGAPTINLITNWAKASWGDAPGWALRRIHEDNARAIRRTDEWIPVTGAKWVSEGDGSGDRSWPITYIQDMLLTAKGWGVHYRATRALASTLSASRFASRGSSMKIFADCSCTPGLPSQRRQVSTVFSQAAIESLRRVEAGNPVFSVSGAAHIRFTSPPPVWS
jgi:hypothetical protein